MSVYANRYEKLEFLGSGATGEVQLVKDVKTGLKSALKLLRPNVTSFQNPANSLEGFKHEFSVLKDINHPNIAKVYDIGRDQSSQRFYICTEYVKGKSAFKETENLTITEIENLFIQALRALNYLHKKKIYHFDIKPDNLLITKINENLVLKIIDFGFANFFERHTAQKAIQDDNVVIIGSAPYTSPEIIKGEPHDGRADLYSLACTFYKIFTRELPFYDSQPEKIHWMHIHEKPKPLSELNPKIPDYLDKILLKMMSKNPDDRYEFAEDVIKDLNFSSPQNYEVETIETRVSYVPGQGRLIEREEEFERFLKLYRDRFQYELFQHKPYLIIAGQTGAGKSRFLQECINVAKRDFLNIMTWEEMKKTSFDEIPDMTLIIGDDVEIESYQIDYAELSLEGKTALVVLTTNDQNYSLNIEDKENVVHLNQFTKEQTRSYLIEVTNIPSLPDEAVDTIYNLTQGNLAWLTKCMENLFSKGFFKDNQGTWSKEILDDLGISLENLDVGSDIHNDLNKKIKNASLTDFDWELLYNLALTGKPTLTDLSTLTGGHEIEEHLNNLHKLGILKVTNEHQYVFSHPSYKTVILDLMPDETKEEFCDQIADYLESKGESEEKILCFRGQGKREDAAECLIKLARLQWKSFHLTDAKKQLQMALKNKFISDNMQVSIMLDLSDICIEMGNLDEARKYSEQILNNTSSACLQSQALERQGICLYRENKFQESIQYFKKAHDLIKSKPEYKWIEVVLKNRLASAKLEIGKSVEAEAIADEAWHIWKIELSEEDKIKSVRNDSDTIYYAKGDYKKAIDCLSEQLKYLEKQPHLERYPRTLYKLACAFLKNGEEQKGQELLEKCIQMIKKKHTPAWLYAVYNELGNLADKNQNYENALNHYKHALGLVKITGTQLHSLMIIYNLGSIYLKLKNWQQAIKHYEFSLRNFKEHHEHARIVNSIMYTCHIGLAEAFSQLGQNDKAEQSLQDASDLLQNHINLQTCYNYQYYWQAEVDLSKKLNRTNRINKALTELNKLEHEPQFDTDNYQRWKQIFQND